MFWSKCSIFHNILKYMIFQRRQKALLLSKRLKMPAMLTSKTRYFLLKYQSLSLDLLSYLSQIWCSTFYR